MSRQSIIHGATIAVLAAGLAACGDREEGTAEAAASLVACDLLTPDEIGEAIGKPVGEGQAEPAIGGGPGMGETTSCSWKTPDNVAPANNLDIAAALAGQMIVTLIVWSWPAEGEGAVGYLRSMRDAAAPAGMTPEDMPIGDEAVWIGGAAPLGGMLHVRSGDVTYTLSVAALGGGGEDTRGPSETLAQAVLAKL